MAAAARPSTYFTGRLLGAEELASEQAYARGRPGAPAEADVLLDVELVDGLLFLALENVGGLPAHRVRVRFDERFRGLGGARRADRLALFRRLEFLGPGRGIRTLLDAAALYFERQEPTRLNATVSWRTDAGRRRSRRIAHDLEVFRDLAYPEEVPSRARPS